MPTKAHLLLSVPDDWDDDQRGEFFEKFVSGLLRPMRFEVTQRLRFTGMEIDVLARGLDHPTTVLVECKAQRDPVPADVISKLLGNVGIRHADAGWLFSTSSLTKDGLGQWEDIQADPELSARFVWFSPSKIASILVDQKEIIDPKLLVPSLGGLQLGGVTLVIEPRGRFWLFEILEGGIPTYYSVFDGPTGAPLDVDDAARVAGLSPRLSALKCFSVSSQEPQMLPSTDHRGPVARVVPGDTWDDLRPARPVDFVGRDDVIKSITEFIGRVRTGETSTRTFAILAPSGWGKSSLVLKLADLAKRGRIPDCSLTAVDTRSATNSTFVVEALRAALTDAVRVELVQEHQDISVDSVSYPLDSVDVKSAMDNIADRHGVVVLIFDQFEELFTKEQLFDTFTAVRELSLDLDSRQLPFVLGFAWKTDVALPQQHPAYYLWHQLSDRRRTFSVRQFGRPDILKIISRAERATHTTLSTPLQDRLVEQCQGLPWLLKKLTVHILRRLSTSETPYELLERELDVEVLFKDDLSSLNADQVSCLKYVAANSPVSVPDVEANFSSETTKVLMSQRLLVRSGMNYVVYWDIFRDYLTDGKVPSIPWARTFQREPSSAIRALRELSKLGEASAADLAPAIGLKLGPCFNLLSSDLVALQLVDRTFGDLYRLATHLETTSREVVAEHTRRQLQRHVVFREIEANWDRGTPFALTEWEEFFSSKQPRTPGWAKQTLHHYAATLRRWLVFSGLLDQHGSWLSRPSEAGNRMGVLDPSLGRINAFLGTGTPQAMLRLLQLVQQSETGVHQDKLMKLGLRNTVTDAIALGLVIRSESGCVLASTRFTSLDATVAYVKSIVLQQETIARLRGYWGSHRVDDDLVGRELRQVLRATHWKGDSARRYAAGLRRYFVWANSAGETLPLFPPAMHMERDLS